MLISVGSCRFTRSSSLAANLSSTVSEMLMPFGALYCVGSVVCRRRWE